MKRQRNIPVLQEVISRKYEYQSHLEKLQKIQASRKLNIGKQRFSEKSVFIEHIKNQKHNNFINKLFNQEARIRSENLKFVDKLNRTTFLVTANVKKERLSRSSLTLSVKKNRQTEIVKQNTRVFKKLSNPCPFVNTKKMQEGYEKIKKIGDRLRKYDHSCDLKVKKYLRNTISSSSTKRSQATHIKSQNKFKIKSKLTNFYNKEDIFNNTIEKRMPYPKKISQTFEQKRKKLKSQQYFDFFNTQVNPQKANQQ